MTNELTYRGACHDVEPVQLVPHCLKSCNASLPGLAGVHHTWLSRRHIRTGALRMQVQDEMGIAISRRDRCLTCFGPASTSKGCMGYSEVVLPQGGGAAYACPCMMVCRSKQEFPTPETIVPHMALPAYLRGRSAHTTGLRAPLHSSGCGRGSGSCMGTQGRV